MSYNPYTTNEYDALFGGFLVAAIMIILVIAVISYLISAFIYFKTAKTNGYEDLAFLGWIPIANVYLFFLLAATGTTDEEKRALAKKYFIIYLVLLVVSFIPLIGILASIGIMVISTYMMYRLFYRWSGDSTHGVLYVICSLVTFGIFFFAYGLIRRNRPFLAD